jgi:hypothetical protein
LKSNKNKDWLSFKKERDDEARKFFIQRNMDKMEKELEEGVQPVNGWYSLKVVGIEKNWIKLEYGQKLYIKSEKQREIILYRLLVTEETLQTLIGKKVYVKKNEQGYFSALKYPATTEI